MHVRFRSMSSSLLLTAFTLAGATLVPPLARASATWEVPVVVQESEVTIVGSALNVTFDVALSPTEMEGEPTRILGAFVEVTPLNRPSRTSGVDFSRAVPTSLNANPLDVLTGSFRVALAGPDIAQVALLVDVEMAGARTRVPRTFFVERSGNDLRLLSSSEFVRRSEEAAGILRSPEDAGPHISSEQAIPSPARAVRPSPTDEVAWAVPLEFAPAISSSSEPSSTDISSSQLLAGTSLVPTTYCVRLEYHDYYAGVPVAPFTNGMDGWRPKGDTTSRAADGFVVELWDRDPDGSDEFLGTWMLDYWLPTTQWACIAFDWSTWMNLEFESLPDPYIVSRYAARPNDLSSDFEVKLCASRGTGSNCTLGGEMSRSWRTQYNNDCNGTCYSPVLNFGNENVSPNSTAMVLASAQRFARVFGNSAPLQGQRTLFWMGGTECVITCTSPSNCIYNACSYEDNWVSWPETFNLTWSVAAHELGHSIHQFALGLNYLPGIGCPIPHGFTTPNNESCANTEGWANYVATRTWWNPDNALSNPKLGSVEIEAGGLGPWDPSGCTASTSSNEDLEVQVTRALWDMRDVFNEGAVAPSTAPDSLSVSDEVLMAGWSDFSPGLSNHQLLEVSSGEDIFNFRDYMYYIYPYVVDSDLDDTVLGRNCVAQSNL